MSKPHRAHHGRAGRRLYVRDKRGLTAKLSLVGVFCTAASPAATAAGAYIANNTPPFVADASRTGATNGSDVLTISLWLKARNQAALDAEAAALYNPASATYRHWLTRAQISARFAPSAADAGTVKAFLRSQGLKVLGEGPDHWFVRAQGTTAQIETAFRVTLSTYAVGGQTIRANGSDPYIDGPAGSLVQVVSGLDTVSVQKNALPQAAASAVPAPFAASAETGDASAPTGFSTACFLPPQTKTFTTSGAYPKATYTGTIYDTSKAGCGYTPANIYAAYNLNALYSHGLDGTGQTIALIETCGSPSITHDAQGFSKAFGLPALTANNFSVVNYPAPSTCAGYDPAETGDTEWTHAIAPGAKILLLVTPTGNVDDIDQATFYAVTSGLVQVVSGSYATPEYFVGKAEAEKENLIAEIGAVSGIASNYASGNYADFSYIQIVPRCAAVPADLPYATGIGGISAALNADGSLQFQTGWETHLSNLVIGGQVQDPPVEPEFPYFNGFIEGSGGGRSVYFKKPAFQSALTEKARMVPDIAWLADPATGGVMLITQTTTLPPQVWRSYGGTGLASSMFSALWAIADQAAGTPLGQAAPYLYHMPPSLITDIVPRSSVGDVHGSVTSAPGNTVHVTPESLFTEPNSHFGKYVGALEIEPGGNVNVISFGQDYYLHPASGWDKITGLGVPNAAAFVESFLPAATATK